MATKHQIDQTPEKSSAPAKRRLRNVTVTMEEDVAKWARMEAARRDISVSKLMAEIVLREMAGADDYERSMREFMAQPALLKTDGKYPSREEAHNR